MIEWNSWWGTLLAVGIALAAATVVVIVVRLVVSVLRRRLLWVERLMERARPRLRLLLVVIAVWVALALSAPAQQEWWPALSRVFLITVILTGAWLLASVTSFGIGGLVGRYGDDNAGLPAARRMRTQLQVVRRLVSVLIAVIAIGAVLFTFPEVRAVGTSVLASAGIVSIIAGLAAQSTLGNVIAGIQLAFSDAIRVGDVVVVEDEWGRIGEITLSYVVVYVWDERRLILPCTYFTSQPFESWTRNSPRILGTIEFDVDWRVPLAELREHFQSVVQESELWDGRASSVVVTDATGGLIRVRMLISAADSGAQFDLCCLVREEMVTWLQREHPDALPVTRVSIAPSATAPASG